MLAAQPGIVPNQFNQFLLLGYGVMALIVIIYVVSLAMRQRNVKRDVELMAKILQDDKEDISR